MAHHGSQFWNAVVLSLMGVALCVVVIIFTALLVRSLAYGTSDLPVERVVENTEPVGRLFVRS